MRPNNNDSTPQIRFTVEPRLLDVLSAARYLQTTTFFVEELLRGGTLPFRVLGKARVIEKSALDAYIDSIPVQTGKLASNFRKPSVGLMPLRLEAA